MPSEAHWFESIAERLGSEYLRYSFTKGTVQEVDFLAELIPAGSRVLDVGCGPGRHAHELHRRGYEVVGVDVAPTFVELASERPGPTFVCADARALTYAGEFDAVLSLCQGAFGLPEARDDDKAVLQGMVRAVRGGGRVILSAFSAYFQVRHLEETDTFDADAGLNTELATFHDGSTARLATACYTPRELRLLAEAVGLRVDHVWSVTPGRYGRRTPNTEEPEFLLVATLVGRRIG